MTKADLIKILEEEKIRECSKRAGYADMPITQRLIGEYGCDERISVIKNVLILLDYLED